MYTNPSSIRGIPTADEVANRWVSSAGAATQRFSEGVQSTQKDPTALAVAQVGKLQANFNAAVSSGRWSRGLQRAGKAGWQSATLAKAGNFATGINAAKDKYQAAMGPVLAAEASLQSTISQMPNGGIEDSIARSAAWQRGLHNWAMSR